jgi:hypothetical protein
VSRSGVNEASANIVSDVFTSYNRDVEIVAAESFQRVSTNEA